MIKEYIQTQIKYIEKNIEKLEKKKEQTPATSKGKEMRSLINFTIKQAKENIKQLKSKI